MTPQPQPQLKISGTKAMIKRPAPQSPANIRPVQPQKGSQNPQHTQQSLPKALLHKILGK